MICYKCMFFEKDFEDEPCASCEQITNGDRNYYLPAPWLDSKEESEADPVNHPRHYTDGKIEVADYIADKHFDFFLGNAIKYISRAGKKDPDKFVEDLEKAIWYINREIKLFQEGY